MLCKYNLNGIDSYSDFGQYESTVGKNSVTIILKWQNLGFFLKKIKSPVSRFGFEWWNKCEISFIISFIH